MKLIKLPLLLILAFLFIGIFALSAEASGDFAAIVNGEKIPMERYTRAAEAAKKDWHEQRQELSTLETNATLEAQYEEAIEAAVLYQLIDSLLVALGAKKEGILVTEEDIREKIEEIKKGFPSSQEFHRSVAEQKMTIEDLKISLKRQLTVDKIKEKLKENVVVLDE